MRGTILRGFTSTETALSTNEIENYIPLRNEGTEVFRPTTGIVVGPDVVRIIATPDFNPEIEEWTLPPGSTVRCVREFRSGREVLVARLPVSRHAQFP